MSSQFQPYPTQSVSETLVSPPQDNFSSIASPFVSGWISEAATTETNPPESVKQEAVLVTPPVQPKPLALPTAYYMVIFPDSAWPFVMNFDNQEELMAKAAEFDGADACVYIFHGQRIFLSSDKPRSIQFETGIWTPLVPQKPPVCGEDGYVGERDIHIELVDDYGDEEEEDDEEDSL